MFTLVACSAHFLSHQMYNPSSRSSHVSAEKPTVRFVLQVPSGASSYQYYPPRSHLLKDHLSPNKAITREIVFREEVFTSYIQRKRSMLHEVNEYPSLATHNAWPFLSERANLIHVLLAAPLSSLLMRQRSVQPNRFDVSSSLKVLTPCSRPLFSRLTSFLPVCSTVSPLTWHPS